MFKNYISVSFQVGGNAGNTGCVFAKINGKTTFDDLKKKIVAFAKDKYNYTITPDDVSITGICEISRSLYKRLVK